MSDLADADSTIVDITAPSASLKPGAGIYDGYWRERALAAETDASAAAPAAAALERAVESAARAARWSMWAACTAALAALLALLLLVIR